MYSNDICKRNYKTTLTIRQFDNYLAKTAKEFGLTCCRGPDVYGRLTFSIFRQFWRNILVWSMIGNYLKVKGSSEQYQQMFFLQTFRNIILHIQAIIESIRGPHHIFRYFKDARTSFLFVLILYLILGYWSVIPCRKKTKGNELLFTCPLVLSNKV